jgi:hypothetical protein
MPEAMSRVLLSRWKIRPSWIEWRTLRALARAPHAMSVQELTGGQLMISTTKALRRFAEGGFAKTGVAHRNGHAEPVWWLTTDGHLLYQRLIPPPRAVPADRTRQQGRGEFMGPEDDTTDED